MWYQTLDRTRDLAIMVRPQRDRDWEKRESTREDNLMSRESHRVSMLALVRGSETPRVERGRVEGGGVLGGELYVDGERGIRVVLPQWTSPPAARLYWMSQK